MGITDVQLSLTSLEEVFLNIAKQAEMDEALANNQPPVDVPLPDGTVLKVPFGVEDVVNPVTGIHYKVRWGTDSDGHLCVLDCHPVGANIPLGDSMRRPPSNIGHGIVMPATPPDNFVDVQLPDGTILRVPNNQEYVLNPVANEPYKITWGVDEFGRPKVLRCDIHIPPAMIATPLDVTPGIPPGMQNFHIEHREPMSVPGRVMSNRPSANGQ